jgi:hypothetical protein
MAYEHNEREPLLPSLRHNSLFQPPQTPPIKDEDEDYLADSATPELLPYSSYTSIGTRRWCCIDGRLAARGRQGFRAKAAYKFSHWVARAAIAGLGST